MRCKTITGRICAIKGCDKRLPESAPHSRRFCNVHMKAVENSSRAVVERGRLNAEPVMVVKSVPDADVITETICRACKGPHQGSYDTGYYCLDCREHRILDIHKDLDRREELRLIEVSKYNYRYEQEVKAGIRPMPKSKMRKMDEKL